MQQAIYLVRDNPCGANKLIFQEMGLTGIRFIDLKNYLDEILATPEMIDLFEQVKIDEEGIDEGGNGKHIALAI